MKFYALIKDLQLVAEVTEVPWTDQMLVLYGLEIIQKTGDFKKALMMEWHGLDAGMKT